MISVDIHVNIEPRITSNMITVDTKEVNLLNVFNN